jgi:imidazole glycerol phosphate synthase glutamine amidotransferase subunit
VTTTVLLVPTGVANTASVAAAFRRLGCEVRPVNGARELVDAARVVLPGVGAFGAAMRRLHELELTAPLRERIAAGRPLLAICLGLQLLCEASDESPGVEGLGAVPATVRRFAGPQRVPQLGWNHIEAAPGGLVEPGHAWFANSYRLDAVPAGCRGAVSDHGGSFVAAFERGSLLACQFHPELSGAYGQRLLTRWLAAAEVR